MEAPPFNLMEMFGPTIVERSPQRLIISKSCPTILLVVPFVVLLFFAGEIFVTILIAMIFGSIALLLTDRKVITFDKISQRMIVSVIPIIPMGGPAQRTLEEHDLTTVVSLVICDEQTVRIGGVGIPIPRRCSLRQLALKMKDETLHVIPFLPTITEPKPLLNRLLDPIGDMLGMKHPMEKLGEEITSFLGVPFVKAPQRRQTVFTTSEHI